MVGSRARDRLRAALLPTAVRREAAGRIPSAGGSSRPRMALVRCPLRGRQESRGAYASRQTATQKIPLLQDGDFCIGESAAIVAYLSRMYSTPERSLIRKPRVNTLA